MSNDSSAFVDKFRDIQKRNSAFFEALGKHGLMLSIHSTDKSPTEATGEEREIEFTEDDRRLLEEYHSLIDKDIAGSLSEEEATRLSVIEMRMQSLEDSQTLRMDILAERRHLEMLNKLDSLTAELHRHVGRSPRKRSVE
jgi:hypothetical protein